MVDVGTEKPPESPERISGAEKRKRKVAFSDVPHENTRRSEKLRRVLISVPFLSQEEVADIPVFDPVSAHIELIERNNVLREVVTDSVIRAELAADGFF